MSSSIFLHPFSNFQPSFPLQKDKCHVHIKCVLHKLLFLWGLTMFNPALVVAFFLVWVPFLVLCFQLPTFSSFSSPIIVVTSIYLKSSGNSLSQCWALIYHDLDRIFNMLLSIDFVVYFSVASLFIQTIRFSALSIFGGIFHRRGGGCPFHRNY